MSMHQERERFRGLGLDGSQLRGGSPAKLKEVQIGMMTGISQCRDS